MMDIRRSGYSRAGGRKRGKGRADAEFGVGQPDADFWQEDATVRLRPATPAPPSQDSKSDQAAESHDDFEDTDKFVRPVITDEVRLPGNGRSGGHSIAVVGLACRFPDADDPAGLFNVIMSGRRTFRRIPPCRVDLADYYSSDPATADATYSTRAALIEGWRFDRAAFGISQATCHSADPAHWLALEVAASALAAAGFPSGAGLSKDRAGVFVGNTLTGDGSRSGQLRLRWPYARQALADALFEAQAPSELADRVLNAAAGRYLSPLPPVTEQTLAGATPGSIAATICAQFGFTGGGFAVDTGGASSLTAIASACSALVSGELDVAIAGGVDVSLDPLDLVGLAKTGVLATGDVRIYDENPTGFLPGEGCGLVLLMRSSDARKADLRIYAEILGWGSAARGLPSAGPTAGVCQSGAASGHRDSRAADPAGLLQALRRAYELAQVDPADVQLIEGCGLGTGPADEAELEALALLATRPRRAALGSVTASIGNTRAAAGAAGLIKAVLAACNGVIPPSVGVGSPHRLLTEAGSGLWAPTAPTPWPDGIRQAGVTARSADGLSAHLVFRTASTRSPGPAMKPGYGRVPVADYPPSAFLVHAADRAELTEILSRIADVAPWLSDAQLQDLACQLAVEAAGNGQGRARAAIVATRQEQLARLAREAIMMLPKLTGSLISTRPGIFVADNADGRVTLLLSGQPAGDAELPDQQLGRTLAVLRKLDQLGVQPKAAVGHGIGELAGLAWAGCIDQAEVIALGRLRAAALAAPVTAAPGSLRSTLDEYATFEFGPPRCRLVSGCIGTQLTDADDIAKMLTAELLDARSTEPGARLSAVELWPAGMSRPQRLTAAVRFGAIGATLLLQTGRDRDLIRAIGQLGSVGGSGAGQRRRVPVVSIDDPADDGSLARAAAALFAAGALTRPELLYPERPTRPIDIWREQVFITNPCQRTAPFPESERAEAGGQDVQRLRNQRLRNQRPRTHRPEAQAPQAPAISPAVVLPEPRTAALPAATGPAEPLAAPSAAPLPIAPRPTQRQPALAQPTPAQPTPAQPTPARPTLTPPTLTQPRPVLPRPDRPQETQAEPGRVPVAGVGPWSRCYAEQFVLPTDLIEPPGDGAWRIHTGGCEAFSSIVNDFYEHNPAAGRTLAVLGTLHDAGTVPAALTAARDAITTGRLVAVSPDAGLTGLWASLHAEHPLTGVVVIRAPLTPDSLKAASQIAAVPGQYRELAIGADGTITEPVMAPVDLASSGTSFPLGTGDVVLISRGAGAAGLAFAQVVALSGAAIAVIGRDHPHRDDAVIGTLEQLRTAGAAVGYEIVNPASAAALGAAVRRIESRLGPVTAIAHAARSAPSRPVAQLMPGELQAQLDDQNQLLDQLVAAAIGPGDRLRLIVTFGSVIGRYGLAGESATALASGVIADHGERLAAGCPGCRAVHVDWPVWSGSGLGEPAGLAQAAEFAGFAAMPVSEGSRLLLKLLGRPELPSRVAVHGRAGHQTPRPVALAARAAQQAGPWPVPRGRFAERVVLHYQGVELITEATVSPRTDPYLTDYFTDGVCLLPPTLAVEAMAQVASALAGQPLRAATGISMTSPIVLSGQATAVLRICALRTEETISVIIRCDHTDFAVDHFSAAFDCAAQPGATEPGPAEFSPGAGKRGGLGKRGSSGKRAGGRSEAGASELDAAEIYGLVCFQTGRFRRLTSVRVAGSRTAIGLADGSDQPPWFYPAAPAADAAGPGLLLGDPGIADAALQLAQVCVPNRRLLFAGCESALFGDGPVDGLVTVTISQAELAAAAGSGAAAVPRPREGEPSPVAVAQDAQAETVWDVEATDSAGHLVATLRGLRMRDAGSLPRTGPWPVPLLGCFLERSVAELGLGPDLEIRVSRRSDSADGRTGDGWVKADAGDSGITGLFLRVRASGPVGCGWRAVKPARKSAAAERAEGWLAVLTGSGAGDQGIDPVVFDHPAYGGPSHDEPGFSEAGATEARRALARAIASCAGVRGTGADLSAQVRPVAGAHWLLLRDGAATIACVLVSVTGQSHPVAIAIMAGSPDRAGQPPRPPRPRRSAESGRRQARAAAR
ncbi:MAG TPA: beta-ketoacyl synthase N-terminal-like domain-containing protein [Streptosporangiaceae bacterium]